MKKAISLILLLLSISSIAYASDSAGVKLRKPATDLSDKASLLRGAKTFMSQCITCHSLKFMRYEQMAEGLGLVDKNGNADEKALQQNNLIPANAKVIDPIMSSLTPEAGKETYGIAPPDLSLITRESGSAWVFTYLHSFYQDDQQKSGVNNLLIPGVAMPNILGPMQGIQNAVYREHTEKIEGEDQVIKEVTSLELVSPGMMTPQQFDQFTTDLVNFLDYVAEPNKIQRYRIGVWVLLFLSIFVIVAYLLKQEYWHDVH